MNVLYEEEGALKVSAILAERIGNSNRILHPTTLYWPPGAPVKSHDNFRKPAVWTEMLPFAAYNRDVPPEFRTMLLSLLRARGLLDRLRLSEKAFQSLQRDGMVSRSPYKLRLRLRCKRWKR